MMDISYRTREKIFNYTFKFVIIVGLIGLMFPLFWLVLTSIIPRNDMFTTSLNIIPSGLTLNHYVALFTEENFARFYLNTIVISIGVVTLTTTTATLGGYSLSRVEMPFKRTFARGILFSYMFPAILLSIPMFIFWRQLGLINSYIGVILGESALALPFSLWLMWQYFESVPYSLEESAQMCGGTRFHAFRKIALPMAKPGIIAIAIFAFAISWNEYTIPKIILPQAENWVVTIGLQTLQVQNQLLWGKIMAASAIVIAPAFLFTYFLQKHLLRGFRIGGVG